MNEKSFMSKRLTFMKFDQIKRNATAYLGGNVAGVQVLEFAPRIKDGYPRRARLLNAIEVPAPVLPPMETC